MTIEIKNKIINILKNILNDIIPQIDMQYTKYSKIYQRRIFNLFRKKLDEFCHISHYLLILLENPNLNLKNNIAKTKNKKIILAYKFYNIKEINFWTTFNLYEKIRNVIFRPLLILIKKKKIDEKKIFIQILISMKKLDFMLPVMEHIIKFDKNDLFGINPLKKKGSKVWFEIKENFEIIKIGSEEIINDLKHQEWKTTYNLLAAYIQAEGDILNFEDKKVLDVILDSFRKNKITDCNRFNFEKDYYDNKIKILENNISNNNNIRKDFNNLNNNNRPNLKKNKFEKIYSPLDNKLSFKFFANSLHYAMNSHVK